MHMTSASETSCFELVEKNIMFTDFTGHLTAESFASVSNKLICATGFLADVCVFYTMLLFFALTKPAPC